MTATKRTPKTLSSETQPPTAPFTAPSRRDGDFPPTLSTATAVSSGAEIVSHRMISTKFGTKAILIAADGTEYWGSPFITGQLQKNPKVLPAKAVSYVSAKYGKTGYKLIPSGA